jgi:hypothetical protein
MVVEAEAEAEAETQGESVAETEVGWVYKLITQFKAWR